MDGQQKNVIHVRHGDIIMRFEEENFFLHTIKNPAGLHARPAGAIYKLAKSYKSEISFSAGEKTVQASSVIRLMSLGASQGTQLRVEARGEDAREALDALRSYMSEHL